MSKLTNETKARLRSATRLIHAGRDPDDQYGFVNTPIYRGSTVLFPTMASLKDRDVPYTYGTKGTPTIKALEDAWSELCGAAGTVLAPTGLAAIALALMTAVKSGDHLLVSDSAYGPTRHFCDTVLARMGVETTYYDPALASGIADHFRPNTTAVLVEAPGSQSFEMQDVPAIAEVAHARGACVIMDNTWATPLFFPPHERGVDLAIEAGTKYLSGHSDLLLGLVSANEAWFRRLRQTFDAFAMCAGPEDAFLCLRGLRTMKLRLHEAAAGTGARPLARGAARGEAGAASRPALASRPRHLEAGFFRLLGPFLHHSPPCQRGGGCGHAGWAGTVRHGLFLGRLRKPRHPLRLLDLPNRDQMGARRPGAALSGRP